MFAAAIVQVRRQLVDDLGLAHRRQRERREPPPQL
jgi:hypothetical protein